jgi:hypothetical protein
MMTKMIAGERDRSFYNGASNWRRENYSAEAEGRLSSPSPVRFEISFLLFQKDDLRPVPGSPNETLVDFSLFPHSSFIPWTFRFTSTWVSFGSFDSFDHYQPTAFPIGFSFRDVTELFVISSQIHLTSFAGVDLVAVGGRTCLTNTTRLNFACTPYLLD